MAHGVRIAALAAVLALAGCDTTNHAPRQVDAVRTPPVATASIRPFTGASGTFCARSTSVRGPDDRPDGLVTVDTDARSLVADWLPSRNAGHPAPPPRWSGPCQVVRTTAGPDMARRVARDIDATRPELRTGPHSCPIDDGGSVTLSLRTPAGRWQVVDVGFSGCSGVGAANRLDRPVSDPLRDDLVAMAPPPWHNWLQPPPTPSLGPSPTPG